MLSPSVMSNSAILWTIACQASLTIAFSRQEHWSGLPFLTPRDLLDPRIEPASLTSPALAGGFLTPGTTWCRQDMYFIFIIDINTFPVCNFWWLVCKKPLKEWIHLFGRMLSCTSKALPCYLVLRVLTQIHVSNIHIHFRKLRYQYKANDWTNHCYCKQIT